MKMTSLSSKMATDAEIYTAGYIAGILSGREGVSAGPVYAEGDIPGTARPTAEVLVKFERWPETLRVTVTEEP
jgi:hypothetical protein